MHAQSKHMTKKNKMKLQMVTCANSSQHAINLRSSPFELRSIQTTYFQHNQFGSKRNMTKTDHSTM